MGEQKAWSGTDTWFVILAIGATLLLAYGITALSLGWTTIWGPVVGAAATLVASVLNLVYRQRRRK